MTGTVKFFDDKKGWGFIDCVDGKDSVFVHFSNIVMEGRKSLVDGERVEYDLLTGPDGRTKAVNVRKVEVQG